MDVEGGNNLMYLPIDKLVDPARTGSGRKTVADERREAMRVRSEEEVQRRRGTDTLRSNLPP